MQRLIEEFAERVIVELHAAFVKWHPDADAIREAMAEIHVIDTLNGRSGDRTADFRTSYCPSSQTLAISVATLHSNRKWHADVVAIIDPRDLWIEAGATGSHFPLRPGEALDHGSVIVLGARSEISDLAETLRGRGLIPLHAENPIKYFGALMRGSALLSARDSYGSNPMSYLALRQVPRIAHVDSVDPWILSEYTDYHAEAQRGRRRPFVHWDERDQIEAIRRAFQDLGTA